MNTGLYELPLVFFTVLEQSAVGAWLVFTFVLLNEKNTKSRTYIHKVMFVILALPRYWIYCFHYASWLTYTCI